MKKVLFSLIIIFSPALLWSQGLKIGIQTGLEYSNMRELRGLNLQFKSAVPFDTKLVADFPGYWYYQPIIKIAFKKFGVGLDYSYNSTGSRLSGKDYSGEYRLDLRINKKSPGIFVEYSLLSQNNVGLWLCSGGGMMYTSLHLEENLEVNNINILANSFNFKSKNYYIQPGFKAVYPWNSLEFEFNAAWLIQAGKGTFYNEKDHNLVLSNMVTGNPVKPEWNGLKIGITVYYVMIKSKSD
ncbi:MAG TPA: hypothetical protein VFC41_07280 [Anaerovoracaceae bacterium]|nr:hypothetical protein [Anaerovoracaceae bacterium]